MIELKSLLTLVLFTTIVLSCSNGSIQETESLEDAQPQLVSDTLIETAVESPIKSLSKLDSLFLNPVDWKRLKALSNQSTSSTTNQDQHFRPHEDGIYGGYTLFRNNKYLGNLTVYYYGPSPWRYNNDQEYFISYYTNSYKFPQDTTISVLNGVHLGMSKSELESKMGPPSKTWNNYLIYHNNKNSMAFFKFNESTINEIEIGRYSIDFSKDSLTTTFIEEVKTP